VERDTTTGEDGTLAAELRENALLLEAPNGEEQTACWSRWVEIPCKDCFNISLWAYSASYSQRSSAQTNRNTAPKLARTTTSVQMNFLFMVYCKCERFKFISATG